MSNHLTALRARLGSKAARFARAEQGALIIFGLMLFVLMAMMGGFAVDLMRYENTRTNLQNTLDRSTLAAAALNQKLNPQSVVRDYMTKAGLGDDLTSVTVTDVLNSRVVRSTGRADTNPFFLHMLGIDEFDALGRSQAEQSISNIEIVLVLDISGSMGRNNKIGNLKAAASNFVDTILGNDPNNRVSITIVPYNAQVNIGPLLVDKFNITDRNGVANDNCVELPPEVYATQALSRDLPMPMMAYADIASGTSRGGYVAPTDASYAKPNYSNVYCKASPANVIRLANNDPAVLKQEIAALRAEGNTSITLGMKWGVTLIDPSMRSMYDEFIASGDIPANLPERPFSYDDPKANKIIVLMTDGDHVEHQRITDPYKTGPSGIFKAADGNYSVFVPAADRPASAGTNGYYVPHLNTWQATAWNSGVEQDWKDIWANLKLSYVAWQFYARPQGGSTAVYNRVMGEMRQTYALEDTMDATLNTSCDQAKANGVTIYGIAYEAPENGQRVIRACASTLSHYFAPVGPELDPVFQSIASNITMLKLTQ